jgi:hypothetical protein
VRREEDKYQITQKGGNPKYLPEEFGSFVLSSMSKSFYPSIQNFEKNLADLIQLFGTYVLLCLLEAGRPPTNMPKFDLNERDNLATNWIDNVIDTKTMYSILWGIIENQKTDEALQKWIEDNVSSDGRFVDVQGNPSPPESAFDYILERFDYVTHKVSDSANTGKPLFEIEPEKILYVEKILQNMNSLFYETFLGSKMHFYPTIN